MASSPNQIVTSPRLRSPCSYSDQFLTEYFVLYFGCTRLDVRAAIGLAPTRIVG